jgi:VWFA-related protein
VSTLSDLAVPSPCRENTPLRGRSRLFFAIHFFTLTAVLVPHTVSAQTLGTKQTALPPETPVLHAETQLVIVDVTVQDKNGQPVHGLRREDFFLTESKQPRTLSHFEEHSSQTPLEAGPELPALPPGTFTDYTSVPPNGALNILLLDALNTPMADQTYVRSQLQQFVKKTKPGTRIAIFGLSQRLFLLQGFSSDPQILKNAVEHRLLPRASHLLDDAAGTGTTPQAASDITASAMVGIQSPASLQIASNLQQFEAEQRAFQTQLRIQYTLNAFNAMAHYLSAFPGRKNLIWFSGSFPIDILPDPAIKNGFAVMEDNSPEFRETTNLLSRAQVAVYPVDARGLRPDPTFSAAINKRDPLGKSSAAFLQSQASEHMTMSQLAEVTGGTAFYNTNDLATAVESAIESGSNYYTLMYSPANKNNNGSYREIRVALNGNLQAAGYRLTYRHGYYTDDQNHLFKDSTTVTTTTGSIASADTANLYAHAAMAHGAPAPEDILFKARVLPIDTAMEQTLAPANDADSLHTVKPPFRRFAVDLAAVADGFQLNINNDGHRTGAIEFNVLLYDNDGHLLNATGKTVQLNLTPETYKRFASGVNAHFEISVPVKGGENFLRIGIRDVPSNRFGVVEIPIASVARLAPLPAIAPAQTPAQDVPAQMQPASQTNDMHKEDKDLHPEK